jgi:hypothetical protein
MSDTGFGVFDTVIGGPAAVPYSVGWALLIVGTVWSLIVVQAKNMMGQRADPLSVWVTSAILACGLGLYTFLSRMVWWATQSIAHEIFPQTRLTALGNALKSVAQHHRASTGAATLDIAQRLKDGIVEAVGSLTWMIAIVSHWQIQHIQQGVYNVVFVFGPLLVGLAAFGLPTARVWVMALFEVSSWSITAAALYYGLETQFTRYLNETAATNLFDTHFLDVMANLFFLSMMMIIVPVVTGRLLGSATLGELARIQGGNGLSDKIASAIREKGHFGGGPDPATGTHAPRSTSSHGKTSQQGSRRPGD